MTQFVKVLPALAVVSMMTSIVSAATITFVDTQPTADVLLVNPTASTNSIQVRDLGGTSSTRWLGFGFKSSANALLDKVTFFIDPVYPPGSGSNANSLGTSMTIAIYSISSQTGTPVANATPLYSETALTPSSYTTGQLYMTFDLANSFALTANGLYGIMISFDSGVTNRGINLLQATTSVAGTGNFGSLFYTSDSGATYTTNSKTVNFVLQTTAVPEVSSLSLLCAIGFGLLASRRAR